MGGDLSFASRALGQEFPHGRAGEHSCQQGAPAEFQPGPCGQPRSWRDAVSISHKGLVATLSVSVVWVGEVDGEAERALSMGPMVIRGLA